MKKFLLKSSLRQALIIHALKRGSVIGGVGILLIFCAYLFLPKTLLSHVGIWIYLLGCGLIAFGLIPYRRLRRLELNPASLVVDEKGLTLIAQSHKPEVILWEEIDSFSYLENKQTYGIGFMLKKKRDTRLKLAEVDLFLPYFSKRAFDELDQFSRDTSSIS